MAVKVIKLVRILSLFVCSSALPQLTLSLLTLIQLCGVHTDPAVMEIVTLLEWKMIDKSPLPFAMT